MIVSDWLYRWVLSMLEKLPLCILVAHLHSMIHPVCMYMAISTSRQALTYRLWTDKTYLLLDSANQTTELRSPWSWRNHLVCLREFSIQRRLWFSSFPLSITRIIWGQYFLLDMIIGDIHDCECSVFYWLVASTIASRTRIDDHKGRDSWRSCKQPWYGYARDAPTGFTSNSQEEKQMNEYSCLGYWLIVSVFINKLTHCWWWLYTLVNWHRGFRFSPFSVCSLSPVPHINLSQVRIVGSW